MAPYNPVMLTVLAEVDPADHIGPFKMLPNYQTWMLGVGTGLKTGDESYYLSFFHAFPHPLVGRVDILYIYLMN